MLEYKGLSLEKIFLESLNWDLFINVRCSPCFIISAVSSTTKNLFSPVMRTINFYLINTFWNTECHFFPEIKSVPFLILAQFLLLKVLCEWFSLRRVISKNLAQLIYNICYDFVIYFCRYTQVSCEKWEFMKTAYQTCFSCVSVNCKTAFFIFLNEFLEGHKQMLLYLPLL